MNQIGAYINQKMIERGLDQRDLALQSGMPFQNVSAVLSGKRSLSIKQSVLFDDILGLERGAIYSRQVKEDIAVYQDMPLPSSLKHEILVKVKGNGGLWSYDGIPSSLDDDSIIEEGLRHLDLEDMGMLFRLWSFSHVKRVWKQRLVSEGSRSNILNAILGMMFFRIKDKEIEQYLKKYRHA